MVLTNVSHENHDSQVVKLKNSTYKIYKYVVLNPEVLHMKIEIIHVHKPFLITHDIFKMLGTLH